MKDLLMAAIVATSACLMVTPFYIPPETQPPKPITQHDTHWSDHVKMIHIACSEVAFLEQEMAYIQGGTPEQQIDLANGVYLACIKQTKIAI